MEFTFYLIKLKSTYFLRKLDFIKYGGKYVDILDFKWLHKMDPKMRMTFFRV